MAKLLDIVQFPNTILNTSCSPITADNAGDLPMLIEDMLHTMRETGGVGLAAIQVAIPLRLFVMDTSEALNSPSESVGQQVFLNPEIIERSHELTHCKEGCLSFPGVFATVKRNLRVKVKAQNADFEEFQLELVGLDAICFQHELDHLDGITFYDRLSDVKKHMIRKQISRLLA